MRKVIKIVLGLVVLLAVLLLTAPLFISTDTIRTAAEDAASEASGMRVSIEEMSLQWLPTPALAVSGISAEDVKNGVPRVRVASGDLSVAPGPLLDGRIELHGISFRDVELRISRQASGHHVHVIHMDRVTGLVRLTRNRLKLSNWKAELYGGVARLAATVSGLQKVPLVRANLRSEGIDVHALLRDATGRTNLSGRLASRMDISSSGRTESALMQNLKVDGPVHLQQGTVEGIELQGPVATMLQGSGPVAYDVFKFQLQMHGMQRRLNDMVVNSPYLDAEGFVEISAIGVMNGRGQVTGPEAISGLGFIISGSIARPVIYPAPILGPDGGMGNVGVGVPGASSQGLFVH